MLLPSSAARLSWPEGARTGMVLIVLATARYATTGRWPGKSGAAACLETQLTDHQQQSTSKPHAEKRHYFGKEQTCREGKPHHWGTNPKEAGTHLSKCSYTGKRRQLCSMVKQSDGLDPKELPDPSVYNDMKSHSGFTRFNSTTDGLNFRCQETDCRQRKFLRHA